MGRRKGTKLTQETRVKMSQSAKQRYARMSDEEKKSFNKKKGYKQKLLNNIFNLFTNSDEEILKEKLQEFLKK